MLQKQTILKRVCSEHNVTSEFCNVCTVFEDTLVSQLDKEEHGNIIKHNIVSQSSGCLKCLKDQSEEQDSAKVEVTVNAKVAGTNSRKSMASTGNIVAEQLPF